VIAIDNDTVKIACAKHNAKIYGVLHKIEFVQKDFFDCVFPVLVLDLEMRTDLGGCNLPVSTMGWSVL